MKTATITLGLFAALTSAYSHPRYMRFKRDNTTAIVSSDDTASVPLSTGATVVTSASPLPTNGTGAGVTTLTVSTTSVRTITSCLPEVIDCPARTEDFSNVPTEALSTVVVTDTIILTETVCPVTAVPSISSSVLSEASKGIITGSTLTQPAASATAPTAPATTTAAAPVTEATSLADATGTGITTLTVSTTSVRTITSCLPEVIDCPTRTEDFSNFPTEALNTVVVTDTVVLTTVVCPVTAVPSISSSVLSDASKGIISGSTLTEAPATATGTAPAGSATAGEQDTTTTETITSTGTRTVTVKQPATTTTVGVSPGGGSGSGNGNGNGNASCDCAAASVVTVTQDAVTVTVPASTVYVTVTGGETAPTAIEGGLSGDKTIVDGSKKTKTKTKTAGASNTEIAPAATSSAAAGNGEGEEEEEEACPPDEIVTVTATGTAPAASETAAEGGDDEACPPDEIVTVTATASPSASFPVPSNGTVLRLRRF